ncbi:ribose-phosphate pyrophosphokinase [candidate division WOR-3 bacterium]|nr:ribose-phosphate pyrophosphokinase [candidate division WOR-3 bacterium]
MELKVFSGSGSLSLAKGISKCLKRPLSSLEKRKFSDGEIFIQIKENVRGRDVFVVQSTNSPAENIIELLLIIDALRRSSTGRITTIIPYFGYGRQEKKDKPRVPISAKLFANLFEKAGANRIVTIDLHAPQITGFFDISVDHLFATPVMVKHIKKLNLDYKKTVIVSPDVGRVEAARAIAKKINRDIPIAIVDKRRPEPNHCEVVNIIGDVKDKTAIIIDDIVDTAGTLTEAANELKKQGASAIYAYITHPVLSGKAIEKITTSSLDKLVVTDTIPMDEKKSKKIEVVSVAKLLSEAITRIHENKSVSSLFI